MIAGHTRAGVGSTAPAQLEEVGALGGVEQQGAGEGVEDLHGDLDVPGLLQPGVPGDADGRELGDLLAPQPRGPAPASAGQPDLLGRDALAAAAQEGGEFVPPDLRSGVPGRGLDGRLPTRHRGHASRMPRPETCCQVLLLPA
ncbi:hypothetical protein RKD37_006116 [Streptomyces ambofaciens]